MMLHKTLEQIFTLKALKNALDSISSKSVGIDEVSLRDFRVDISKNIEKILKSIKQGTYAPEPIRKIEIEKSDSNSKRPIGLSSIKDKIVQKVLYLNLRDYFDKKFSSSSYAYRHL